MNLVGFSKALIVAPVLGRFLFRSAAFLFLGLIPTFAAQANTRVITMTCEGSTASQGASGKVSLILQRTIDYDQRQVSASVDLTATGSADGNAGSLSGHAETKIDVSNLNPSDELYKTAQGLINNGDYAFTDGKNLVSLVNISSLLHDPLMIGRAYSIELATASSQLTVLKLKAISVGASSMTARLYALDLTGASPKDKPIASADLKCTSQIKE